MEKGNGNVGRTCFSVYVDNNRVNESYLTEREAEDLAVKYVSSGFRNVFVADETLAEGE